ncbi:MAG: metal ABC transporter substrate-binding protein [Endomicrobium sp.]|jgi:ABC-type Zn uptake system ZnuABC Zn-binding protein ZnuA|nr:metal ABC transporter substrate-binding protein [Endomicrobium sp.]
MENKIKKFITFILLPFLLLYQSIFAVPFEDPNKTKIVITVTTADIYQVVKEIGGNKVDVYMIIQPLICPSSYDITPKVVERTENSNLVLSHKWENWISRLKLQAGNRGILYKQVSTEGNWMIPYIHIRAAEEIKDMLAYMDVENAKYYEDNFTDYVFRINFASDEVKKQLESAYGKKVISNDKIKDFLEWIGFEVVSTYGKTEDLTVKKLAYLVSKGKKQGVTVIVDNLQSGAGSGRELADNINAKQCVISNFPIGNSYVNTLKDNGKRLHKAIQ